MKTNLQIFFFLLFLTSSLACDPGSFLDTTGVCLQCDISCNTCKSSDGCNTCYQQMFLVARGNLVICDLCYKVNKGCDICLTASKCQSCSAGYLLRDDNTCESCSSMYPNCLLCNIGNYTECLSCKQPFELINGECVSNGTLTEQITTDNTPTPSAQTPNNTVAVSAGAGLTVGQAYQAVMGVSSTQQTTSSGCDPSQVSINGNCYPAIAFCSNYSQTNGSCIACSFEFVLSNGYCLPSTLIAQTQTVEPVTTTSAAKPTCSSRQYFSNGVCNDVGAQCLQFDSQSGMCYICASGFSVFNGLCIQQAPPTSPSSTSADQPSSNQSNSNQANTASTSTLPHCQITDPTDSSHCLACVSGYTIVDELPGVCFQIN